MADENQLKQAALAHGIELAYTDTWWRVHEASDEVLRRILRSLETSGGAGEDAGAAIDQVLVIAEDTDSIPLRIPAGQSGASVKLEIEWENGEVEHRWHWLPELRTVEPADSAQWIIKRLPLPSALRLGYHRLRLYWMKEPEIEVFADAQFIVCPKRMRTVNGRHAGLALSLYGLRSSRNWGCGDFTDLRGVIDAFAPAGAAFIALNPLHAIANRQPYNTSPYLPQCVFYRNFIYLDVERVGDARLTEAEKQEIEALRSSEFVEYERVARVKLTALWRIFEQFAGSAEFDQYAQAQGALLEDYATYCVLDEEMHRRDPNVWLWTQWPEEYREPSSAAVREFAAQNAQRVRFFQFLQWQLSRQAAEAHAYALVQGMPIGLYHDLALATDSFGADLWAKRPFFVAGCRVGAPPDELAPSGQDWGFPPPNRDRHRSDGYRLFAQSIRNAAEAGGALRIDHVMRFFRLYWIPEGANASQGTYVTDYAQDLLGILALESARGNFVVIGEDLGTVTGEVRHALGEAGVLSYRLLWFERDGAGNFRKPDEYQAQALVCSTTHDLPTLAGFALGRDLDARKAAGLANEDEYRRQKASRAEEQRRLEQALADAGFAGDPLGFLLATPCLLAAVNQEDLSGETEQQNLPGSTWQYPNWRRKMRVTVEEIGPLAEKFAGAVERSGRGVRSLV